MLAGEYSSIQSSQAFIWHTILPAWLTQTRLALACQITRTTSPPVPYDSLKIVWEQQFELGNLLQMFEYIY